MADGLPNLDVMRARGRGYMEGYRAGFDAAAKMYDEALEAEERKRANKNLFVDRLIGSQPAPTAAEKAGVP